MASWHIPSYYIIRLSQAKESLLQGRQGRWRVRERTCRHTGERIRREWSVSPRKGTRKREQHPKWRENQMVRWTIIPAIKSNESIDQKRFYINPRSESQLCSLINREYKHIEKADTNLHSFLFHLLKASTQNIIYKHKWHTTDHKIDLQLHFPHLYQNARKFFFLTSQTNFQLQKKKKKVKIF